MSYESMADDIAALLKFLGIARADLMGYSLGGGVALRTTIQHPEVVNRLVVVSTPFKRDGRYPSIRDGMAQSGPRLVRRGGGDRGADDDRATRSFRRQYWRPPSRRSSRKRTGNG
jgi:pimeloyl-ACP methyl ester carboxylesterase